MKDSSKKSAMLKAMLFILVCMPLAALYKMAELLTINGGELPESPVLTLRTLFHMSHLQNELDFILIALALVMLLMNLLPRGGQIATKSIVFLLVLLGVLFRGADLMHIYYEGGHIIKSTLDHLDAASAGILVHPLSFALLIISLSMASLAVWATRFLMLSANTPQGRVGQALLIIIAFFGLIALARLDRELPISKVRVSDMYAAYPALAVPAEVALARSYSNASEIQGTDTLEEETAMKLRPFGLRVGGLDHDYPLLMEHSPAPLPYAAPAGQRPNIILVTMESLSTHFIGSLGGPYEGLTPNMDYLAGNGTVIGPHYNSATPTMNSLVSILCSFAPPLGHEDWTDMSRRISFDLLCLPEMLTRHGYSTYDITSADPNFAQQKPFLMANGMQHVMGMLEIKAQLNGPHLGKVFHGYSDMQVMRYAGGLIKDGALKEPYFLTVSTTDLHVPFRLPEDVVRYKGGAGNPILDLVHNSDAALGVLLKALKESGRLDNTLLVVTADHAMLPGTMYAQMRGAADEPRLFDTIPLIIHWPLNKGMPGRIETPSSSVDITPSLLHLLGMAPERAPFEGLSVFGPDGRQAYPNLLGTHSTYQFILAYGDEGEYFELSPALCQTRYKGEGFNRCDMLKWWRHKKWLMLNNRIWPGGTK